MPRCLYNSFRFSKPYAVMPGVNSVTLCRADLSGVRITHHAHNPGWHLLDNAPIIGYGLPVTAGDTACKDPRPRGRSVNQPGEAGMEGRDNYF